MVVTVAAVLLALSGLHVYWAFGGRRGVAVAVPTTPTGATLFAPGPFQTLAVAGALGAAVLLVLGSHGFLTVPVPVPLLRTGERVLGIIFLLRALGEFRYVGFFKRVHGTSFAVWDTRVFTPLCVMLGAALWMLPN